MDCEETIKPSEISSKLWSGHSNRTRHVMWWQSLHHRLTALYLPPYTAFTSILGPSLVSSPKPSARVPALITMLLPASIKWSVSFWFKVTELFTCWKTLFTKKCSQSAVSVFELNSQLSCYNIYIYHYMLLTFHQPLCIVNNILSLFRRSLIHCSSRVLLKPLAIQYTCSPSKETLW